MGIMLVIKMVSKSQHLERAGDGQNGGWKGEKRRKWKGKRKEEVRN